MQIRSAEPSELSLLSELCYRSKAVWGYDEAFMAACRDELRLELDDLMETEVAVAELSGAIVAVAQVAVEQDEAELMKLFVEPDWMNTGAGRVLFEWCCKTARDRGARRLTIDADPDAAAFYLHMGAEKIGYAPSGSIPGRMLPMLAYSLGRSSVPK